MKSSILSIAYFLLISLMLGCQESKKDEATAVKPKGAGRRACSNQILYKFIYPDNDYAYGGTGCITYFVHRGSTRQVKVIMSNIVGYSQDVQILITHPNDGDKIQYTVASYTGGSLSFISPVPGTFNGSAIRWTQLSMPPFTTYELTLNITGIIGSSGAENGVSLVAELPCPASQITDCDADENLHLVLVD